MQNHVPESIFALPYLVATLSMGLVGYEKRRTGQSPLVLD